MEKNKRPKLDGWTYSRREKVFSDNAEETDSATFSLIVKTPTQPQLKLT